MGPAWISPIVLCIQLCFHILISVHQKPTGELGLSVHCHAVAIGILLHSIALTYCTYHNLMAHVTCRYTPSIAADHIVDGASESLSISMAIFEEV